MVEKMTKWLVVAAFVAWTGAVFAEEPEIGEQEAFQSARQSMLNDLAKMLDALGAMQRCVQAAADIEALDQCQEDVGKLLF